MTLQLPSISQEVEHEPQHEGFEKIGKTAFAIAAVFAVAATAISVYTMWLHIKNYKNPSQQRQIIRILWMVPIYAISSWISLANKSIADYIETVRDMYEAFVIYVFFNLLISYLGGERELLVNLKRRPPTAHMFPVNLFSKEMNVSAPTLLEFPYLGILQFVFLKPIFSFLTLAMKSSDVYQEGFISVSSGYVWVTFLYNISVSVSMYCLVIFFFATRRDLDPYRPVPKFLCIKAIIFFSFWQGVVISVLVYLGVIREAGSYSADNIARALQDFLICLEMVAAAYGHWKAFNHSEYLIDEGVKLSARMSVPFAVRDSIGLKVCRTCHNASNLSESSTLL
ncbi:organic solute transporter Ostalpha-domain-containing protein [Paraphysoderma sedebokerense]|nr:organic solute transporter Ostalpha-domain-containing protein [Paraphysoderma sedebokerense]